MDQAFLSEGFWVMTGLVCALVAGWAKDRIEEFTKRADRHEERTDRGAERQTTQGETLAGAVARIASLESSTAKIADALERLARIEEWRILAGPKLEQVEHTSHAVTALNEQVKTIFNRMDDMPEAVVSLFLSKLGPKFIALVQQRA